MNSYVKKLLSIATITFGLAALLFTSVSSLQGAPKEKKSEKLKVKMARVLPTDDTSFGAKKLGLLCNTGLPCRQLFGRCTQIE